MLKSLNKVFKGLFGKKDDSKQSRFFRLNKYYSLGGVSYIATFLPEHVNMPRKKVFYSEDDIEVKGESTELATLVAFYLVITHRLEIAGHPIAEEEYRKLKTLFVEVLAEAVCTRPELVNMIKDSHKNIKALAGFEVKELV